MFGQYRDDIDVVDGKIDVAYQWDNQLYPWELASLALEEQQEKQQEQYYYYAEAA